MIVLKYAKQGAARFISHIDFLRHIERIIRRADISVRFSQGFNPHPLLYFSAPTPIGIGSVAEYLCLDTDLEKDECLERYNKSVPESMKAENSFFAAKNPNLQAAVVAADYIFPTPYDGVEFCGDFEIRYTKKDKQKQLIEVAENVSDRILKVFETEDGRLCMRLTAGNVSLRADRVANALAEKLDRQIAVSSILKTTQYVMFEDKLIDVDIFLSGSDKTEKE